MEHDTISPNLSLKFPADPEHGLLRLAVIGVFFASALIVFGVSSVLLSSVDFGTFIAGGAAVIAGVLTTRAAESGLKRRWPSGREVVLEGQQILLKLRDTVQRDIDGSGHVNVHTWRFPVPRRTRVPKGWFVVAIALVQDDLYLPVYTFVDPKEFPEMPLSGEFSVLSPPKKSENSDLRLAGQQRRLRTAEFARWNEGAELSKEHFVTLIETLRQNFPSWMPKG
jgi:hypothetical protein